MIKKYFPGLLLSLLIAIFAWQTGNYFPLIGGPVAAIVTGMVLAMVIKPGAAFAPGIQFSAKKLLQYAVILLGFGMNLSVVLETGRRSLPIILLTITTSLVVAYMLHRVLKVPGRISTLIGVGSSICGGSAIAATAPVIAADDEEVAQSISVIFFFNVLAAIIFPVLGAALGFSTESGGAFGIFAGTAINDTSSVTAAASTWDSLYQLGTETLDMAVTVKLTRTLAIIPITLVLALYHGRKAGAAGKESRFQPGKIFPVFILGFVLASVITTAATTLGISPGIFIPFKSLSKFLIVMAMGGIGLNTNLIKLIRTGGKPLLVGFCCWFSITVVSLMMQRLLGIW